jgi:hypothetical protein
VNDFVFVNMCHITYVEPIYLVKFLSLHKIRQEKIQQTKNQQMLEENEILFFSFFFKCQKYLPPTVCVFH